jgi:transposase
MQRGRKGQKGGKNRYDVPLQRKIVKEYLEGDLSLEQLGVKYGGVDRRRIHEWKKRFSSELADEPLSFDMTDQERKDIAVLHRQLEVLKKKVEHEQMRNFALETMIDLAKTELGVDVRKNFGAKQPKE